MKSQPILQLTDIAASYEKKEVLRNVNLTVYENDFLGIIGPNGGGKTTLIKKTISNSCKYTTHYSNDYHL